MNRQWQRLLAGLIALGCLTAGRCVMSQPMSAPMSAPLSDQQQQTAIRIFESKIRPVLVERCYECHAEGSGEAEGGLQLDLVEGMRGGGERGPAVVPGKPDESWLIKAIEHREDDLRMPPKQAPLTADQIADFREWIRLGAVVPEVRTGESRTGGDQDGWDQASAADHWAYAPLTEPALPVLADSRWPVRELDHFILARLDAERLEPSADAAPTTLVRRLYFDLLGLPPSLDAVDQFESRVTDKGIEQAIAATVDQLLRSPQFGERWGRHWLDVARYAESSGKEANISFPYAWRYRDYVIDCFNADLPFDRFLTEQLAGDLLPYASPEERARLLVATGFLAIGVKNLDEMNPVQFQADLVDEQIDTVTRAVIGSSVACARCHDHKFDPFSMQDYYALAGIFSSTRTYFGTAVSPANRVGGDPLPLPRDAEQLVIHKSIPAERVRELKDELSSLEQEQQAGQKAGIMAAMTGKPAEKPFTLRDALRIFWRSGQIEGELEKVDEQGNALPLAMGVSEADQIADAQRFVRGDVTQPAGTVPRRMPAALAAEAGNEDRVHVEIPLDQSGRRQLAQWLTDPHHPLTARVYVNRVWQKLFGAGLVSTVDDFGLTGQPPRHPELLDHLAVRFTEEGWSTKKLVRELVLSRSYRQSSEYRPDAFLADPDNRLLWRMPKRRLEAEAIRDAMLAVSGELDLRPPTASLVATKIGDRPVSLVGLNNSLPHDLDGAWYRAVYLPVLRDRLPDMLDLFDVAEPNFVTGQRQTTNVPLQSLYMMNSDFVRGRASSLAQRTTELGRVQRPPHPVPLPRKAGGEGASRSAPYAQSLRRKAGGDLVGRAAERAEAPSLDRIELAFRICFARDPTQPELDRAAAFLATSREQGVADTVAWTDFCQALLATAEFQNLD